MAGKATTISDIARIAGVSKKSVSRVLNDESGISDAKRKLVLDIIEKEGYQPDRRARALAGSGSYLIAFAYNNTNSAYVLDLLQGALIEANGLGYEIILHPVGLEGQAAAEDLRQLIQRSGADGLVLSPPLSEAFHMFDGFMELGKPIVRVAGDDVDSKIPQIGFDDRSAAFSIVQHLLQLGHRKIAFVGGPEQAGPTRRRFAGYRDAIASTGIELDNNLLKYSDFTFLSGMAAGDELLSNEGDAADIDAVMCCNDALASGVVHAARNAGLRVPENLSVTGFDDAPIASQVWPPLTTVRQPLNEMGATAIRTLVSLIEGKPNFRSVSLFDHELMTRNSTAPK